LATVIDTHRKVFLMRWFYVSCFLVCSVSSAQTDFLDPQFGVSVTKDIVYATGAVRSPAPGSIDLLLDVYEPTGAGVPPTKPGFVTIHGGGFTSGDKSKMSGLCTEYAERGYVCVSINYRLMGDDPPTPGDSEYERAVNAAVEDAAKAVIWLKANAATYGIDPSRIAIGGNSAGAATSLFVGFRELGPALEVQAIVSFAGALFGYEFEIDPRDPPVILIHGESDTLVPYFLAEWVANAAAAAGVPNELHILTGVPHAGAYRERNRYILPTFETPNERIQAFLHTHLRLATIGKPPAEMPLGGYGSWGLLILVLGVCALRRIPSTGGGRQ
jgi:acetyl esterase/lipase